MKGKSNMIELTERERLLIAECLILVAKMKNIGVQQMAELIEISNKMNTVHETPETT